ncbi:MULTISPECIES: IclR family transcriptional regulator [unclassified Rhodococcus (in: high G+C Gram-positive bacteria)]|uniref:IclR family transcriptional regulator n=1 Tax=unclassified Rhodococcus (in: high G+C Gram-positive bacteria) TaxID=192944 RepID=UPI00163AAF74|nr:MULTISPECIES: IclR family transcriptional regulator [unclassified Rhodococcus (in: high G+C Gram-positive bacteria)]MBC2639126.1 IclR family transcriptional regulator [Rhodococcus sp. 3A]MBC2896132.1 IclR family transcriptional regulator [Rhodococcus sp. 4CII]
MSSPRSGSQAVERAIAVLACFEGGAADLTLSALAARTGLAVSTAYRIVQALVRGGLLERDERTDCYRVGPSLISLALPSLGRIDAESFAPHLYSLAARLRLTASLGVAKDDVAVTVFSARPPERFCTHQLPGARQPLQSSAMGMAILAFGTAFARGGGAVTTRSDLERVRQVGYAATLSENREVRAIAVPVLDADGRSRGALGVQALRRRLTDDLVREIVPPMRGVAARIGAGAGSAFPVFR